MIFKMDESTERLTLYQTLQTSGAYDIEYFTISNEHFLAVANYLHYYDASLLKDSIIYKWNGKLFVVVQKIPTKGATHFTFFTINGDKYIAVTNYYDGSTRSLKSVIYKWGGGRFNKFQEIATEGARGCAVFIINNNTFIAFANDYDSKKKYSVHPTVFKWSGGHFVKLQSLQTYGAWDVKSFQIKGHTFLALANYFSGRKKNIDSFIFKWNGNKFDLFQSIPTRGARVLYPFVISGQTFLGVANYYGDSQRFNTKSVVYQASGSRFVIYQEIPTQAASDITSFEYKGDTYLAVSTYSNGQKYNTNSALYKWM